MKFNKKLMAGALASLMVVSSFAAAAPNKKNLVASYGVMLRVNGSNFTVSDDSMRPFITQDGRTYVSIAALNQMGIATAAYDKASKTVSVNSSGGGASSGNLAQLQAQIQSQTSEISRLQYENNQLKAEIEKLKGSSDKKDDKKSNGSKSLSDLSSSDKRTFVKEIENEIRYIRAETRFSRNQRFEGQANISSRSVSISLYPYSKLTEEEIKDWNDRVKDRRLGDQLADEYADFVSGAVKDMLKGIMKDYSGYDIEVSIFTDSGMKKVMVEGSYHSNRDRTTASVLEIK